MPMDEMQPNDDLSNYPWIEGEKISRLLSRTANVFIKLTSLGHNSLETPIIKSKELKEGEGGGLLNKLSESTRKITNTFKEWYQDPKPFGNLIDTGMLYMTPPYIGLPLSFANRAWNYYKTGNTGYNYFNRHNWPGKISHG